MKKIASLPDILGFTIFIVLLFNNHIVKTYDTTLVYVVAIIAIYLFKFTYEYQRITLTIARVFRIRSKNTVVDISSFQANLSSPLIGFLAFAQTLLTALAGAYFFLTNLVLFGVVILLHLFPDFNPLPIPYSLFFRIIQREFANRKRGRLQRLAQGGSEAIDASFYDMLHEVAIEKILKDMPHDKMYEKWAFKEYGKRLYE